VDRSWDKIGAIEAYCDPVTAEDLVRVLGTAHGAYLAERVTRHRRGVPDGAEMTHPLNDRRCWGTTIWRLNDPWPILYWSAVDAYGEPKIPYYYLRRAYAPVLVAFERTPDVITTWVVNDGPVPIAGTLTLRRARFDGEIKGTLTAEVAANPGEALRCLEATPLGPINLRTECLWATLTTPDQTLDAAYLLIGERYLHLPAAHISVRPVAGGVELTTDVFARQVTLAMSGGSAAPTGAVFEDNFFDMVPGETRRVAVLRDAGGAALRIHAVNAAPVELGWPA
jgi:beta-mannosidase